MKVGLLGGGSLVGNGQFANKRSNRRGGDGYEPPIHLRQTAENRAGRHGDHSN